MKKHYLLLVLGAFIVLGLFSCQKEGIYNPKQKIHRIYYEHTLSNAMLSETWTWSNNLLTTIIKENSYHNFEYQGKQVSSIQNSDGSSMFFNYNGSKIASINCYDSDFQLKEIYEINHEGSKISSITSTNYVIYKNDYDLLASLNLVFVDPIVSRSINQQIKERLISNNSKPILTSYKYTCKFEWEGDNVSKVIYEESNNGHYWTSAITFSYDDKLNPYYGSLFDLYSQDFPCSKNNITNYFYSNLDGEYWQMSFSYTYDGMYPIKKKFNDGLYDIIFYYEYEN